MAPNAQIDVVVDRSVSPASMVTSAPLLIVPADPKGAVTRNDFRSRLEQFMASGGTILFTHGDVSKELQMRDAAQQIGRSHPLLTSPFEINPGSVFQPEYVEVNCQAAAFDVASLLSITPLFRINLITYALGRHPAGVVDLGGEG